ncbi:MAG TPA: hypothetical protein VMX96_08695 [Dehalococcoidia bacterium]|nr:hypothetical protein [Dehalococcoidia bacterium]
MTLEIILGVLILAGTLAGTGLGYYLSMRGKREEWAKEYREKRILPLVEHVNRHMQLCFQLRIKKEIERDLEKQCEESKSKARKLDRKYKESNNKEHLEKLIKANEQLLQLNQKSLKVLEEIRSYSWQLSELIQSDAWLGLAAIGGLDEELEKLTLELLQSSIDFTEEVSIKRFSNGLELGSRILSRAHKVIIEGGKPTKVKL